MKTKTTIKQKQKTKTNFFQQWVENNPKAVEAQEETPQEGEEEAGGGQIPSPKQPTSQRT